VKANRARKPPCGCVRGFLFLRDLVSVAAVAPAADLVSAVRAARPRRQNSMKELTDLPGRLTVTAPPLTVRLPLCVRLFVALVCRHATLAKVNPLAVVEVALVLLLMIVR